MVENGSRGTKLITEVAQKTWKNGGVCSFYRGLPLALVGIFPYSAIDLGTFEYLKRAYVKKHAKQVGCREEDVRLPVWTTLGIGAVSGSVGASVVYPINLLRTRLQAQGTSHHPQTYTGMWDVTMKTYKAEGIRGMYRGLVPNMMKVIPAVSIVSRLSWWSERAFTHCALVICCVRTTQIRHETEIEFDFLDFLDFLGFRWSMGVLRFLSSILYWKRELMFSNSHATPSALSFCFLLLGSRFVRPCAVELTLLFSVGIVLLFGAGSSTGMHDRLEKRVIAGVNGCLSDLTVGGVFVIHRYSRLEWGPQPFFRHTCYRTVN
jgi:hypothetical protein